MFTEERPSFEGRYYRIDRALNSPRPIQPGGPRILIGGSGERRTLRLLARYGDMGNWFGSLDELKHKREVFLTHCEVVGRNPADVLLTVMAPIVLVRDQREADGSGGADAGAARSGHRAARRARRCGVLQPYLEAGFTRLRAAQPRHDHAGPHRPRRRADRADAELSCLRSRWRRPALGRVDRVRLLAERADLDVGAAPLP